MDCTFDTITIYYSLHYNLKKNYLIIFLINIKWKVLNKKLSLSTIKKKLTAASLYCCSI